ncbi:PaaI family thioesterase [bacterium]|nr:PaaI family thioesterase [bacterium]
MFFSKVNMSEWEEIPKYPTCFVCGERNPIGLNMTFYGRGSEVEAEFIAKPEYCGYEGIVHGGIITAVLDEGMGWTGWMVFGKYYLTMELKVRFRAPVRPNVRYKFKGEMTKHRGKIFFARGSLIDPDGAVVADGEGKYYIVENI